jgi:hypothetical protein
MLRRAGRKEAGPVSASGGARRGPAAPVVLRPANCSPSMQLFFYLVTILWSVKFSLVGDVPCRGPGFPRPGVRHLRAGRSLSYSHL